MIRLTYILSLVLGVWLLQRQAVLPPMEGAWLPALALAAAFASRRLRFVRIGCHWLFWGTAGFYWAALGAYQGLADQLAPDFEGRTLAVSGIVASLPQPSDRSVRFRFDVEQVITPGARVPRRLLLNWYAARTDPALPEVHPGERWRLGVQLKRPRGTANPHGFDVEVWLLEQGIGATGHVVAGPLNQHLQDVSLAPAYQVERAREAVVARIGRVLGDAPYSGVLQALTVGAQAAVTGAQWEVFQRTGVVHLMSISGLHVTMFSTLVFALVRWLWGRHARLPQLVPARRAAVLAGAAAALGYALLAGFGVPAQRTVYMLAVVGFAVWTGRMARTTHVLGLALAAVVLLDPWAVLAPGFWLSFGAVALIFLVSVGRLGRGGRFAEAARVQWAITLGLTPLLLALFQQVSLVSPLANAFAIPVVSLGVVPLALAGSLLPVDFGLHAAHALMAGCMALLEPLARLPTAVWEHGAPPAWGVVAACLGTAWMLLPAGFPARWLGLFGVLPLVAGAPPGPPAGALWLTVLDVGQGLAVVARTERHVLVYDTGPAFAGDADAGARIVLPYLRGEGVSRIDTLVVSHDDNDHSGGAVSVLQGTRVELLTTSLDAGHPVAAGARQYRGCVAGDRWQWDGVDFELLHPAAGEVAENDNARSCVLRIVSGHGSVLLTGDIELASEARLVARAGPALRADVVVAPHHGGKHSSSESLVRAVAPRAAVFSAGYRNQFDHPRPDVVARYRAVGSRIYRTDRLGALSFRLESGKPAEPAAYRQTEPRYWRPRDIPGR